MSFPSNYINISLVDADAIVLDMGLELEELGRVHGKADLIASADIRLGLANTGVMLLRNTPWMGQFLRDWWYGPSSTASSSPQWRKQQCDQDAFDRLYAHYTAARKGDHNSQADDIATKVRVLPMDALNSHPPATLHQHEDSAVLHLMGEETAVRSAVFRRGWAEGVCATQSRAGASYPPQLGLHRQVLQNIAIEAYKESVQQLLLQLETQPSLPAPLLRVPADLQEAEGHWAAEEARLQTASVQPFEQLSRAAHHYCDLVRAQDSQQSTAAEEVRLRRRIFAVLLSHIEHFRRAAAGLIADLGAMPESRPTQGILLGTLAQLLKKAAEAGNDVFGAETAHPEKLRVAEQVFGLLEVLYDTLVSVADKRLINAFYACITLDQELQSVVHESSRHIPLHMRALLHQALGSWHHRRAVQDQLQSPGNTLPALSLQQAAEHLRASLETFSERRESIRIAQQQEDDLDESLEDGSTLLEVSLSMQLLAGVVCSQGRYEEGLQLWGEAIAQARSSLLGIDLGIRYDNLAVALYNAAVCHSAAGRADMTANLASEAAAIAKASSRASAEVTALVQVAEDLLTASELQRKGAKEEEWEECTLDEDCEQILESLPEREAAHRQQQQEPEHRNMSRESRDGTHDLLEGLDVSGMTAEEVDELRDVRARHSRLTRQGGVRPPPLTGQCSNSLPAEAPRRAEAQSSSPDSRDDPNSRPADAAELTTLWDRVRKLEAGSEQLAGQVHALSSAVLLLERRLLEISKTIE